MMQQIKASSIDILAEYKCPECDWSHYIGNKQYEHPKFIVVCDCGFCFKPAHPFQNTQRFVKQSYTADYSELINILVSQGFDQQAVTKVIKERNINTNDLSKSIQQIVSYL